MKNLANFRKHGVEFETALRIFADPLAQTEPDLGDRGEERWRTVGQSSGLLLLIVVYTAVVEQDQALEFIRIISARPVNRQERRRYEQENG